MGGFLMSLLLGFTGLTMSSGPLAGWPQRDVVLPAGWQSIEVERLWLRGKPTRLMARQGRRAELLV
jgi:hypothetical protein